MRYLPRLTESDSVPVLFFVQIEQHSLGVIVERQVSNPAMLL